MNFSVAVSMHMPISLTVFPVLQPISGATPVVALIASDMLLYEYEPPGAKPAFVSDASNADDSRNLRAEVKKLN